MKSKLIATLFIFILTFGWQNNADAQKRKLPANMQYSFACITESTKSGQITDILNQADDYLTGTITSKIEVTDKEQNEFGEEFLMNVLKYYKRNQRNISIEKINFFTLGSKIQILLNCKKEIDKDGTDYAFKDLDNWFRKNNREK